ncbi:hypothetical protein BGZ54_002590 [Gamsiella multidivaricata]|nr:hypothetical protein BGZ54_002590 [Gamsiella multidivaricata]
MAQRERAIAFARYLTEKKTREAMREKAQIDSKDISKPIYTYQSPKLIPGDVSDLFGPESIQNRDVLPGDFVEVRRQGRATYGIYVRGFDQAEGRLQSTSVVLGDHILEHRTADVVFRIPGFLFMDKFKTAVGHWDVDANPATPPAGSGKIAAAFADESTLIMGTFYTKFNTVYDTFWHKRNQTSFTVTEAAKYVFGKEGENAVSLTLQELYATHLYLTQDVNLLKFVPSVAVRWTGEFAMRPPKEVQLTETVIGWMRKDDSRLGQFLEKAKVLVDSFRQGDKSVWKDTMFTESDRTLIEFVRQTAFNGYSEIFTSPHLAYLPKLLRPLAAYDDIDARTAFMFLNEIGIWPSWYNMEINRSAVSLTASLEEEQAILDRIKKLNPECLQQDFENDIARIKEAATTTDVETKQKENTKSSTRIGSKAIVLQDPTEIYRRDPCDSIRHDFGDSPIYAIDDPTASELDDAFSMEPVPITSLTPKASTWIHVHVADPTSILPPMHELSRLAAERVQTAYLPERTWPMLPRDLTEETMSLKNDGKPKKVMTFSARISDVNGEILEYKIRPGYVRNVVTLNYDDVDDYLTWNRIHGGKEEGSRVRNSVMSMPVERQYYRERTGTINPENGEMIKELQGLQILSQRHQDYRLSKGAFNFNLGRPMVEITPYPLQPVPEEGWKMPTDYSQWQEPHISCRLDPAFASPARMMVAEYMILAGRVAAIFSQEHGLPTMYRNQPPPAEKYRTKFDAAIREKTNPLTGMIDITDMLPLRPYIPGAEISTTSLGHWSMGVHDGYCKVTSPLRRYSDMVSHWQLKGALLNQHRSMDASTSPVFNLDTLTSLTGVIRDRERMLGMLESRTVKFWVYEMLRRRMENGLSNIFDGIVLNPTGDGYNVLSTALGFQTVVKAEEEEAKSLAIGSRVKFEVNNCVPQRPYIGAKHIAAL